MPHITRKYQLKIIGDNDEVNRVYKYLREGTEAQNKAMNEAISALYASKLLDMSKDDRKELTKLFSRVTNGKNETGFTNDIQFSTGLATTASIKIKVKQDFDNACKKGLMYGRVSLPSYKSNNPLLIPKTHVCLKSKSSMNFGIYSNYLSQIDLFDALEKDNNPEVYLKFCNNITFRFVFGNPWNGREQRKVFEKIFDETYYVCASSIEINRNGKIILNLCLDIPKQEHILDDDIVVGVDLGMAIPAMCALNNSEYERLSIGSIDDFLRVRTQLQNERKRIQSNLRNTNGGHGRKKKLQALDKLKDRERNFVQTYNHMVSKRVIDFALKNNARYINIEDLSGFGKNNNGIIKDDKKKVLSNWSYYELQNYITYKAKLHGIEVRKVNPSYTSQTCSYCGEKGIRKEQAKFICINPDCKCHKIFEKDYINADFNAARNIAMSVDFIK